MGRRKSNLYQRGNRWYVRFIVDGKEIRKSAGRSQKAAEDLLARLRTEAERSAVGLHRPKSACPTLAAFAPRYQAWARAHKESWARDDRSLVPLLAALGSLRLYEITKARAEAYMQARRDTETARSTNHREAFERRRARGELPRTAKPPAPQKLSPASVNREVACLRKLLSYAVDMGELDVNPLSRIRLFREPPGRIPTLEPEDKQRLVAALPEWMRPIVRLAMLTGCRQSEILALRWKHVDLNSGTLAVEDSKSGEARRVPLHPALLDELRERRGPPDGWVVAMPERPHRNPKTGRPMEPSRSATSISHAFRNAVRKIGRPDLRFHDLRHVCGSELLATGASLPEVATMLGHKTLVMAKSYAHVSPVRLASLVAAMPAPPEIVKATDGNGGAGQEEEP